MWNFPKKKYPKETRFHFDQNVLLKDGKTTLTGVKLSEAKLHSQYVAQIWSLRQKRIHREHTSCSIRANEKTSTLVSYSLFLRTSGATYLPMKDTYSRLKFPRLHLKKQKCGGITNAEMNAYKKFLGLAQVFLLWLSLQLLRVCSIQSLQLLDAQSHPVVCSCHLTCSINTATAVSRCIVQHRQILTKKQSNSIKEGHTKALDLDELLLQVYAHASSSFLCITLKHSMITEIKREGENGKKMKKKKRKENNIAINLHNILYKLVLQ